eukprot:SRR837773.9125.p2 GENE.SRR837773.9125~~SRR837773.9125.p2  ORF type:complete len:273 (+),score=111.25 SRR837773.9125:103-921(+)
MNALAQPVWGSIGQDVGASVANQFTKSALRQQGGSFLFCIPIQVGPASPYARNVRHWMHAILVVQALICCIRFVALTDFLGGFWMTLLCGMGWYAWYQDMNITYVCLWGLGCTINGVFDCLGLIIPLVFDVITLQLMEILLRSLVPISELLGAAFGWHLYVDYYRHGGGADAENPVASMIGKLPDPMAGIVDEVDPQEASSLVKGLKKQAKGLGTFDAEKGIQSISDGAQKGKQALVAGLQGAGQSQWLPGFAPKGSPASQGAVARAKAPCC